MSRMLDSRKAEEKDLCKDLYNKLRILAQLHKPSDEFLKVLSEDMFLKPNPKAFFQVTSFLFELLDPAEFRKRFYWPLCDKKAEAHFRSSTVQYLNYLNEKHNLNWSQLTNYLVVMPGGMRFISFMLEFVEFLVTELTKRKEKELSELVGEKRKKEYESVNIKNLKKRQEIYMKECVAYAEQIESAIDLMKKNTDILENKLEEIAKNSNIPVNRLKDPNFINEFEESNWKLYRQEMAKRNQLPQLNSSLKDLQEKIEYLLSGETEKMFNRERLQESHNIIQTIFPDLRKYPLFKENEFNYDAAIKAFNHILPIVQKQLNEIQQGDFRKLEFESAEMEKLRNDFFQIEEDITNALHNSLEESSEEDDRTSNQDAQTPNREGKPTLNSSLEHKFINTPPIKFDIEHAKVIKPHLPLLGDFYARDETFSFASGTTLRTPGKSLNTDTSFGTSKKTPGIIDAHALIRTIRQQSSGVKVEGENLSMLASKWKEREEMLAANETPSPSVRLKLGITTPTIIISTARDNEQNHTPENTAHPRKNLNNSLEFDLAKASTSPSGRFECSVKPGCADIPKLLLKDESILELEDTLTL